MSVDWGGYVFILLFLNKNRVFCLNIRKLGSNPYKKENSPNDMVNRAIQRTLKKQT